MGLFYNKETNKITGLALAIILFLLLILMIFLR